MFISARLWFIQPRRTLPFLEAIIRSTHSLFTVDCLTLWLDEGGVGGSVMYVVLWTELCGHYGATPLRCQLCGGFSVTELPQLLRVSRVSVCVFRRYCFRLWPARLYSSVVLTNVELYHSVMELLRFRKVVRNKKNLGVNSFFFLKQTRVKHNLFTFRLRVDVWAWFAPVPVPYKLMGT